MLAVALLPESLRPGQIPEHHSFFDWRGWSDALHTPSVPAILITADRSPELKERALKAGIRVLHKPLKPAALRALSRAV